MIIKNTSDNVTRWIKYDYFNWYGGCYGRRDSSCLSMKRVAHIKSNKMKDAGKAVCLAGNVSFLGWENIGR